LEDFMQTRRATLGLTFAALALTTTVALSAPAVAGASVAAAKKPTNPNSPFCQFGKKEIKSTSAIETKEETALESGNWATAQKLILSTFTPLNAIIKADGAALNDVPSKVKAAIQVSLKAIPAEENVVRTSTSVSGFTTAVQTLFNTKKFQAAAKIVDAYQTATCGSLTPAS
jgi:hypothetical protein